ncbi:MAG: serine hydrolase domain-containing protein [Candidatus Dormibacteria bacterium]
MSTTLSGRWEPAFAPLADELRRLIEESGEVGAAVAVYLDGEVVADFWAGAAAEGPWQKDTLVTMFSVTKGLTALCVQLLYDRGLLDPEAAIGRYWPEYATAGKESTLVRHVLSHTAGVISLPRYWEVIGPDGRGLEDRSGLAALLAAAPPAWVPGTAAGYHALTYGYILGELVERVTGMSLGRFFATEVATPLGLDLYIGLPRALEGRVTPVIPPLPPDTDTEREAQETALAAARRALARGELNSPEAVIYSLVFMSPEAADPPTYLYRTFNQPWIQSAEIAAGNAIGDARSLARMYAALACGGELDGVRLVSQRSIDTFFTEQFLPDGTALGFALGYGAIPLDVMDLGMPHGARAYGHSGAGGALGFADPERRLSFGFTKNQMTNDGVSTARLMQTVYRCL